MPTQRFELEYDSIDITGLKEQRKVFAFLDGLRSGAKKFTWLLPLYSDSNGLANTNPTVKDTSAGVYDVQITHTAPDDFLVTGDLIKFSSHDKVYMVMEDVVSSIDPIIKVNAPLRKALVSTDTMITSGVEMTVRLDPESEPVVYSRIAGDFDASFSAKFIEAL